MKPSAVLLERWRSANLTGAAKHVKVVRVRPGYMEHGYLDSTRLDDGSPIYPPLIWKGNNHSCWKGVWTPTGDWITVPNAISKQGTRSFEDQGSSTITIVMANVAMVNTEGALGLYHLIQRGWYSPLRGVRVTSRPRLWSEEAEWTNVLNGGFQIETWEGYGPEGDSTITPLPDAQNTYAWVDGAWVKTADGGGNGTCVPPDNAISRSWTGIIESCEVAANPDQITVTARDFGVLFTDQRIIGRNKAPECRAPVSFADRRRTQGETPEAGTPTASSGTVTPDDVKGVIWQSAPQATTDDLQWLEIHLPEGYYEDFFLAAGVDGMEMWIALNLTDTGTMNRTHPVGPGWVDLGYGNVPGTSVPFIRHWGTVAQSPSRRWGLGESFDIPAGSALRIYFSHLAEQDTGDLASIGRYVAAVNALYAFRYGSDPTEPPGDLAGGSTTAANGWILTEDASDVVRMIFIWAGFREWVVENFGWSLAAQMHYGQTQFFQDVLNEMLAQGNFVMFMGSPSANDLSIGVPHFVHQAATDLPKPNMLEVRDDQTLEIPTPNYDLSNLPYVIRYRGEVATKAQGGQAGWGLDLVTRYQATYYPPWSGEDYIKHGKTVTGKVVPENRIAGVQRYFSQTLGQSVAIGLRNDDECYFACVLAAIQYCLAMVTIKVQIPGLPGIELNDQISVIDEATGLNTRMWVASVEENHTQGPSGKWEMTVSGSLIDTQDMAYITDDYLWAYRKYLESKPPPGENMPATLPDRIPIAVSVTGTSGGSG